MKVLIFTHIFPYPLNEGGKVAQFGFLEYLAKEHEVILVTPGYLEDLETYVEKLKELIPRLNIQVLNNSKPMPVKGILGLLLKIANKVQWRLNRRINRKIKKPFTIDQNNFFVYPARAKEVAIVNQLVRLCEHEKPDLFQVDFIDNADIINSLPAKIPKILVHHDLRFASINQICEVENQPREYTNYLSNFVKTIEMAFIRKFDAVITFSKDDKNKLMPVESETKLSAIPFSVLDKNIAKIDSNYHIKKLVFIGPDQHLPNYDAIEWYANEMAETIWNTFKLKLFVIGKWSAANVKKFAGQNGIEFTGFVENIQEAFKNSIMIVPLRMGSGIRTKLLDAFAFGTPVISTHIGCEGLGVSNSQELAIADTPHELVNSVEMLITNAGMVNTIRNNANQFVRENFSQQAIYDKRINFYKELITSKTMLSN